MALSIVNYNRFVADYTQAIYPLLPEQLSNVPVGLVSSTQQTQSFTAEKYRIYDINSSSGSFNIDMATYPQDGDIVYFTNMNATLANNNIIISNGTKKINGVASPLTLDSDRGIYMAIYDNTNSNWNIANLNNMPIVGNYLSSSMASAQIYVGNSLGVGALRTLSGAITINSEGVTSLSDNIVSNSKLAKMAALTLKGNNTGSLADPMDITIAQVSDILTVDNNTIYVSVNGLDTNNGKSPNTPLATLGAACTMVGGSGKQIIVYPGSYSGPLVITNQNLSISSIGGDISAIVNFSGTITINHPSSSLRITGIRFDTLDHSGAGSLYLDTCSINTLLSLSGSGYFSAVGCNTQGSSFTGLTNITGTGSKVFQNGCLLGSVVVSNALAMVYIKDNLSCLPCSMTLGTLSINNTPVYAATPTSNAITCTGGYLVLDSMQCVNTPNTSSRISLTDTLYSYWNSTFDIKNSTFTNSTVVKSNPNSDSLYIEGVPVRLGLTSNISQTSNFVASNDSIYNIDTSSNIITCTLPSQPYDGSEIIWKDVGGNLSTNNLILQAQNGGKINGSLIDLSLGIAYGLFRGVYSLATNDWLIVIPPIDVEPSQSMQYSYRGNNTNSSNVVVDNNMKSLTESTSNVLTITADNRALLNDCSIQVKESSAIQSGFLSATNFAIFDGKQDKIANPINNNIVLTNSQGQTVDSGYTINNSNPFDNPSSLQLTSVSNIKNYADFKKAPREVLRQYWDASSDPSTFPVAATLAGSASYQNGIKNNYFISLINGKNQKGYVNFDVGANYPNFKFVVYYRILNTDTPADALWFFANGTQTDSGTESDTQGLVFTTDYYNGGSNSYQSRITIFNGASDTLLSDYSINGVDDINENFIKMTMIRYGAQISISLENQSFGIMTRTVTSSTQVNGTRFGVGGKNTRSTPSRIMNIEIKSMSVTSYES